MSEVTLAEAEKPKRKSKITPIQAEPELMSPAAIARREALKEQRERAISNPDTLSERAVFLQLSLSRLGVSRRIESERVRIVTDIRTGRASRSKQPNKELVRALKKILDCPEMRKIVALDERVRSIVGSYAVSRLRGNGTYLIPIRLVEELEKILVGMESTRLRLVLELVAVWDVRIYEMKESLRYEWSPSLYPTAEQVQASFAMRFSYWSFGSPTAIKQIGIEFFRREEERARNEVAGFLAESKSVIRMELLERIQAMKERLEPPPDGKRRVIRESVLEGFSEWLRLWTEKNVILGDSEVAQIAERMRRLTSGVKAGDLAKSKDLREATRDVFALAEQQMKNLVTEMPDRMIVIEEIEE